MATHHADVVVIGAGPGGYVAAIRLAQLGKKVLLVEKEALGGVCLNWGCIPSKALIYAAGLYEKILKADEMGIRVDNPRVDLRKMVAWKDGVVKKLTSGVGQLLKTHGVKVLEGTAAFNGPQKLSVKTRDGKTETIEAPYFLIATGSSPVQIPGVPFDSRVVIESREALDLTEIPRRLALIGGGVIGLELGVLYAKLGTEVTVIELLPTLLAGVDADILQVLNRCLKKRGIRVLTGSKAKTVDVKNAVARLTVETPKGVETLEADKVLVAIGRTPNSRNLGLEKAGVKTDAKGFITANNQLRTSAPNIFAIGDVVSAPLLAHKASKEGLVAADVIAGKKTILDVRALPAAIFTDPEIATVGLTEAEARQQGYTVKIGTFPFAASGRALSMNEPDGLIKIVTDAQTDLVLGVHMIGPEVSELIAEATLAIEMGATAEDLALTVHTHPTLPESLMEAAEAVHGLAIHIYQKENKPLAGIK